MHTKIANFGTVLVAGGDIDDLNGRQAALSGAGYSVEIATSGADFLGKAKSLQPTIAILDNSLRDADACELTRRIKDDPDMPALPVMLMDSQANGDARHRAMASGADDYVEAQIQGRALLARMQPLFRLATMESEVHDRQATAAEFGVDVAPPPHAIDTHGCRVLLVAADNGLVGTLRAAVGDDFEITHESDPYVAGDLLERSRYDAAVVVLDGAIDSEKQLYLCGHVRNNPRLFNLPILLLTLPGRVSDNVDIYAAGASIVHDLPIEPERLGLAIKVLVRRQRRRWWLYDGLAETLAPATGDRLRGVYSTDFLRAHLGRLVARRDTSARPLSLVVFAIANAPAIERQFGPDACQLLMQQMADFIAGLVRIEDLSARLSDNRFCVVLPDALSTQAEQVIHRVSAVLGHAEFHLGEEVCEPIRIWIQAGRAAFKPGDSADGLIGHALADIL